MFYGKFVMFLLSLVEVLIISELMLIKKLVPYPPSSLSHSYGYYPKAPFSP